MKRVHLVALLASIGLAPPAASAQEQPPSDPVEPDVNAPNRDQDAADEELPEAGSEDKTAPPSDTEALPPPRSDNDTAPPVAAPATPPGGLVEQAGVGGQTGYGRAGVLELGGSAGFTAAPDFTSANLTPSIGWFVADNLQLSGLLGFSYVEAEGSDATMFSALVEPSYHLPFNRTMFGFLGIGVGGSHVESAGFGFAMAPRVGANLLIGRSGVLTPSVSYEYTTHDAIETPNGTLLAVTSALAANIGYTVMW